MRCILFSAFKRSRFLILALEGMLVLLVMACGTSATATPQPADISRNTGVSIRGPLKTPITIVPEATPELSTPAPTTKTVSGASMGCSDASFVNPNANEKVAAGAVKVEWTLANCVMVFEYYQREKLVKKIFGVKSGDVVELKLPNQGPIRTQLKIWVSGNRRPSDSRWIVLTPSLTPTATPTVTPAPPDCPPKIVEPQIGVAAPAPEVESPILVSWDSSPCEVVTLQFYQDGTVILEVPSPDSGNVYQLDPGLTQIKLFCGDTEPCDEGWLTVKQTSYKFQDNFEIDKNWNIFEEIVGGDPCYGDGIGEAGRSTDVAYDGQYSLRVWANKSGTNSNNHVIAAKRVANLGVTGKWRYQLYAYVAPETADTGQAGPEFSMQNTREVSAGEFRTSTAGIQYQPQSGKWAVWREHEPGRASWEVFVTQTLLPGEWHFILVEADYANNKYGEFLFRGPGVDLSFDLSSYRMAHEDKGFDEEAFWLTAESEDRWNDCAANEVFDYKVYYDHLRLQEIHFDSTPTPRQTPKPNPVLTSIPVPTPTPLTVTAQPTSTPAPTPTTTPVLPIETPEPPAAVVAKPPESVATPTPQPSDTPPPTSTPTPEPTPTPAPTGAGGCFAQVGEIKAADGGWLLLGLGLMGLALAGRRRRMT